MAKEALSRVGLTTARLSDGIKTWDSDRQHYTTFRLRLSALSISISSSPSRDADTQHSSVTGPGGAQGCRVRHEPPSLGRPHSCAQAAPPLGPRRRRLSGSGHVIPRWSLPRSRRSAIAIRDGPRSKMPSLACWLTSLLAPDRYGATEHLFPVRRGDVADLEAESREPPGGASAGSATSTAWLASCPGSSHSLPYVVSLKLSSVPGPRASWDATGRRGTGSSDHQADAVRLRATPEPERSHRR
jgi:hypothetical protein